MNWLVILSFQRPARWLCLDVRRFEFMNITRIKIVMFWLSFLLFGLLLCFSWRHRLLWIPLFGCVQAIFAFIKPRWPVPPPRIGLLLWLILFLFVFAAVVHGLLFPQSASLYLVLKILFVLLSFPVLCHKIYADYVTFRSSGSGNA